MERENNARSYTRVGGAESGRIMGAHRATINLERTHERGIG